MTIRTASIKNAALAAALAIAALLATEAAAADLEVRIEGLSSADGDVRVALHRQVTDGDFPDDRGVVDAIKRPASAGTLSIVFAGVPTGTYAVAAFHDADRDGELARNFLGMPTEGYGFSNGAVASWARPASRPRR